MERGILYHFANGCNVARLPSMHLCQIHFTGGLKFGPLLSPPHLGLILIYEHTSERLTSGRFWDLIAYRKQKHAAR